MISTHSVSLDTYQTSEAALGPTAIRDRIAILDVLRGLAILFIFVVNIDNMGNSMFEHFGDARLLGWSSTDQACWWFIRLVIDGTQRGVLQFLFGAGAVILLKRTFLPDGPVAVVDVYLRRNVWLAIFGLLDVFGLFWFGDILLPYALAALLLFPMRRFSGKVLLAITLLFISGTTFQQVAPYRRKADTYAFAQLAQAKLDKHHVLSTQETRALADRAGALAMLHTAAPALAAERTARLGSFSINAHFLTSTWIRYVWSTMPTYVTAVFFSSLLGMALFKFGIIQGEHSSPFYVRLALLCYAPGLALRAADAYTFTRFQGLPDWAAIFEEPARLLVTIGHVALINLLIRTPLGRRVLEPFQAVGRVALSAYLTQNSLAMWVLFPASGLGLWGRYGWFGLTMLALAVMAAQLVLANLWLRYVLIGPFEWLWRSLTYKRLQPFFQRRSIPEPFLL